jgi:hypothetical protein
MIITEKNSLTLEINQHYGFLVKILYIINRKKSVIKIEKYMGIDFE